MPIYAHSRGLIFKYSSPPSQHNISQVMHKTLYTPALHSYVAWLAGVLVVVTGRRTRDQEVACFIPGRFASNTDSGQDCSRTRAFVAKQCNLLL